MEYELARREPGTEDRMLAAKFGMRGTRGKCLTSPYLGYSVWPICPNFWSTSNSHGRVSQEVDEDGKPPLSQRVGSPSLACSLRSNEGLSEAE